MQNHDTTQDNNTVLVIGGGVGGIKAALDLAEAARDVVMIDKAFAIGGLMTQLDRTFPTNNCDLCTLSPHLAESGRRLHIELLTGTQLDRVAGQAGRFTVTLRSAPRYIDLSQCTACGKCFQEFPECVRFRPGLDHRAPTCMRYPKTTPEAFSIALEKCPDVEALVRLCPAGAIRPEDAEQTRTLQVGAIVLAPGAELLDPSPLDNWGYGKYPNVVTGLEYERILSASGPTAGELVRPSDGRLPRKVAWIQCVGSRGINKADVSYCSSVCCMVALKEALVTKERFQSDIEASIFFMDMRTFGKDYELYYARARDDFGIKLIRCRPHSIVRDPQTENLSISYATDATPGLRTDTFDMVVLSTGFRIPPDLVALAERLGIQLNEHSFARTPGFNAVATSRPGIYVCGLFESPKDIPETMIQASAAACLASGNLQQLPTAPEPAENYPPEKDVTGEDPRIGVFVCDCGDNIGGIIAVDALAEYARGLPRVKTALAVGHGCSRESLARIRQLVQSQNLNRIVIGGCSPRTHETLFQDTARRVGLNKYLVEMANIRDQDTWVHMDAPAAAAIKARELIRMAVAGVTRRYPLADNVLPMNKDILVVGGGVAGMNAALSLADRGFKVYLAEKTPTLGGVARNIHRTLEGDDVQAYVRDLVERTGDHPKIETLTGCVIVDHAGMPGHFTTGVHIGPRMYYRQLHHGVTILATGAVPNRPPAHLLGEHPAVLSQLDLDVQLAISPETLEELQTVVMIQCVGSRTPDNPNCSRVCCQAAIKNALRLLSVNPEMQIFILYRDVRTYGLQEDYYHQARKQGVMFIRYDPADPPVTRPEGERLSITFTDPVLGRPLAVSADRLVLSTGMIADEENTEDLAAIFRLPRTADGFFLEDHAKLRPVDLPTPGFFVAGTAHAPKTIRESTAQAQAAAGRALTVLARDHINFGAAVARVDRKKCAACLVCVRACPFDVPHINADGYSEIDPAKCHGCGVCAAECPARAIQLMQFDDDLIAAGLEGLLEGLH